MSIRDILDLGVDEKLRSGEAKTRDEARALVSAELERKNAEQQQARFEKMVEAGEAASVDEARAIVVDRTERAVNAAMDAIRSAAEMPSGVQSALDRIAGASSEYAALQERLSSITSEAARLAKREAVSFDAYRPQAAVKLPEVRLHNPVFDLIEVTRELVGAVGAVEGAVNEVRKEQRQQGKATRSQRKKLLVWRIAVSVVLAALSSPYVVQLWKLASSLVGG
ncbi:MAG: hypothetical protein OYL92_03880 [Acidobacteriota bacterium]|nr:hypothetical protein [Acidobacteriota bacterium]MDE3264090.1 hypothetical protein [Acidobacteriota bacterium]